MIFCWTQCKLTEPVFHQFHFEGRDLDTQQFDNVWKLERKGEEKSVWWDLNSRRLDHEASVLPLHTGQQVANYAKKRKIKKIHVAFDYCSIQSTVHENCYNSQSGKKWQPKIGQNMPKTSSNPNFCLKMRHNEAQLRTIQTNLAHFRTKFKLRFTYKKHFTNQTLGDGF